jgi:GNAT superfamily N-acetyltransferase
MVATIMNPLRCSIHQGAQLPALRMAAGLSGPELTAPPAEAPDARIAVENPDGEVIAHAALWWRNTPQLEGDPTGTIGGFACQNADAAKLLLDEACARLHEAGCKQVVGPMNGNTWRRYRFVTGGDSDPPFLLEPSNPPEYPLWWQAAGFTPLARYTSSRMALEEHTVIKPELRERLLRTGLVLRPLAQDRYEEDLRTIHRISLASFAANFLYTPLDEASFTDAYRKIRSHVDPRLILIAERDGQACGFAFAIPDLNAAARGENPAVIVKTLAVDPNSRSAGLGSLLVDQVHRNALELGHREAIHALQHETNTSLKITGRHHGRVLRHYTLFSRQP